ncbi:MAG: ABC transporter ATP-binding protein [Acidobacteria bacterium]|nr:MAG: ABC transporter ATP-binding protein [Acidobacteriota bacterium]REK07970.1 MAG: ABC transporter ATP-binding protein [Acidobacteriota bacterium]
MTVVQLRGVSLDYSVKEHTATSIKEYFIQVLRGRRKRKVIRALREVDLEVERAECVGIIGRNGAGKSTMLKVVSGILRPTRGTVSVDGRVAPILELGTGFDYELSGRENIELNALLLGLSRREIKALEESIIDFSGIRRSIEQPVKSYSLGMVARLGFAIATASIPSVLILDEVTAVGDAEFMLRCQRRVDELVSSGTTTLVVSHDETTIRRLCTRCVLLEGGEIRAQGKVDEVLAEYGRRTLHRIDSASGSQSHETEDSALEASSAV